ncbi:hypothetical protein BgiBS90_019855 [Biomphalaria glabrata]|nr:hypothetical protein BgiBS90_019855 [Biomphalaria glabrata]
MDYAGFSKLMNTLVMYSKFYAHHAMEIHKAMTLYTKKILAETLHIVRNAYPEQGGKLLKPLCNINYTVSSSSMEQQAALFMFSRFVETFGVSNDNSNTIKAIYKSKWKSVNASTAFASIWPVEVSVSVGIGESNIGSLASRYFFNFLKLDVGLQNEKLGSKMDTLQMSKAQRAFDNNENLQRQFRKNVIDKERRIELVEGGAQTCSFRICPC